MNSSFPVVNRGASILPYLSWGSQDPSVTPTPGIPGMLYVQIAKADDLTKTVGIFQKIDTAGADTNWQKIGPGGGGVTGIGAIDAQPKSANGAVIVGTNLYLQTGDATHPGLIDIVAQQIAGEKTFLDAIVGQEISTPSNPPAGFLKLYFKSGDLYQLDSAGTETKITNQSISASQVSYTPSVPGNWPTAPTNADEALNYLAEIANLLNPQNVYVDAVSGSDVTGTGAALRPFQSLEAALAYYIAAPAGNYLINLAPGNYGSAPISIPVLANKSLGIKGASAGCTSIGVVLSYTALGLSDENFYISDVSVGPQMVFDLALGGVVNILLTNGGYHVKRIDTLPAGPQVIRIFNSFCDGFDISGTCLMTNCQFVGGGPANIVHPAGFLLMTGCLFASMTAQIDGTLLLAATLAQGTSLTGAGAVASDASSLANLTITGPSVSYTDNAQNVGYNPAVPGDWAVPPADVKAALDELASTVGTGGANKSLSNLVAPTLNTSIDANGKDWLNGANVEASVVKIGADKLPVSEGSTSGGNDAFTKYLLHADNSAVDSSASAHVPLSNTMVYGTGHFAQAFDCSGGGKRLTYTSDADVNFGTGEWTIDFWATYIGGGNQHAVNRWLFAGGDWYIAFVGGNTVRFGCPALGITLDRVSASIADGNFHHIAVERQGTNFNIAIDGVWGTAIVNAGSVPFTPSTNFAVGAISDSFTDQFLSKLDEVRVSKGVARWSQASSFVPPTSPYAATVPAFEFGANQLLSSAPPTTTSSLTNKAYVDSHQTLVIERTISGPEAAAKQLVLADLPRDVNNVALAVGGVEQVATVDFNVSGAILTWSGLGLDAIGVVAGDVFVITYEKG